MNTSLRISLASLGLVAVSSGSAQTPAAPKTTPSVPPVTLKVGDQAPPLRIAKWIKGQNVPSLADGKVHVVEFWATWCGPCKGSMPHLSELAEKYKGKATFLGVNVWESRGPTRDYSADVKKVSKFAGNAGRMMDYTVEMDNADDAMARTWLMAAGQNGIPASFVVDGKGTILWIGHPLVGLDEVVALAVEGKLDVETGKRVKDEIRAKFNQFYELNKKHSDAMKAGDYKTAYEAGDRVAALLPSLTDAITMKLSALVHTDRVTARQLAEKSAKENDRDPLFLIALSRTLLDDAVPGTTQADYDLALRFVKTAEGYNPDDLYMMPTLALAYSKTGNKDKAVATQERFVRLISDPSVKAPAKMVDEAKERLEALKGSR